MKYLLVYFAFLGFAHAQSNCVNIRGNLVSSEVATSYSRLLGYQRGVSLFLPGVYSVRTQDFNSTGQLLNQTVQNLNRQITQICVPSNKTLTTQVLCSAGPNAAIKTLTQTTKTYAVAQSCPVAGYAWEDLTGCFSPMPPLPPPGDCNPNTVGTKVYNCYTCVHTTK